MPTLAVTNPDRPAIAGGNVLMDAAGYVVLGLIFAASYAMLGVARLSALIVGR